MSYVGKTTSALLWGASLAGLLFVAQACGGTGFSGASSKDSKKDKPKPAADAADGDDDDDKKTTGGKGTSGSTSGSTAGSTSGSTAGGTSSSTSGSTSGSTAGSTSGSTANGTGGDTSGSTANGGSATNGGTTEGEIEGGSSQIGSGSDPGELTADELVSKGLVSDLTIKTIKEDDCEDGKVKMKIESYYNGTPYFTTQQDIDCPSEDDPAVVIPTACRTDQQTCLKVTFTNDGKKQDTFGNTLGCIEIEGPTVYVDTNGAGITGTCLGRDDDAVTFSCAQSPGIALSDCL